MSESASQVPTPAPGPVLFDAVLYPHRSLSPTGFWLLMGVASTVGFGAGMLFTAMGAWPVLAFFGLELLLLYGAFRWNYRQARLYETIRLTPDCLTVRRVAPDGREATWTFQPFWLRVEMDEPATRDSRLTLASHGRRVTIGGFLTPDEKADFARALRRALRTAPGDGPVHG